MCEIKYYQWWREVWREEAESGGKLFGFKVSIFHASFCPLSLSLWKITDSPFDAYLVSLLGQVASYTFPQSLCYHLFFFTSFYIMYSRSGEATESQNTVVVLTCRRRGRVFSPSKWAVLLDTETHPFLKNKNIRKQENIWAKENKETRSVNRSTHWQRQTTRPAPPKAASLLM